MRGRLQGFRTRLLLAVALAVVSVAAVPLVPAAAPDGQEATVIYLVRHAEKVMDHEEDPGNPPLTEAGAARAEDLVRVLGDAGVTRIFSSEYERTLATARPLAARLDLEVEAYNPRDLEGFAAQLREMTGRIVVSGHSNTTPELVGFLGGEPGEPIVDAEYDRLYVLTIQADGQVTTLLLRYGSGE